MHQEIRSRIAEAVDMQRSTSTTRVSDEHSSPSSQSPGASAGGNLRLSFDGTPNAGLLPVYSPSFHATKRERSRLRSAENAVHLIPLVLILCAIILWLFSNPVDLIRSNRSVVSWTEKIKDNAGALDVGGTQNNLLSR